MKFEFFVSCRDCKVYMELGEFDYEVGRFEGPYIAGENKKVESDFALRRFLEEHSGHRISFNSDLDIDDEITMDYKAVRPLDAYCTRLVSNIKLPSYHFADFPESFKYILIVVDVYDWAWDIAAKELLQAMPEVKGDTITPEDFEKMNIRPEKYDVVLVYPWAYKYVMNRLDPRNTVIICAGGEQLKARTFFNRRCSRFHVYGACNETIKRILEERYPSKKVVLLSHGVDTEKFKPEPVEHEEFTVGWVGSTQRGLKRFPLAEEIASEANVFLKVAGFITEDTYRSHDEMPAFYNSVDCLLVTSDKEAHPLIVYEALSCGVPVVSTRVGDVDENVVSGVHGFILEIDDPASKFVEAIKRLKDDEELRGRMSEEARKLILEKWTWSKIAEQYRGLRNAINEE